MGGFGNRNNFISDNVNEIFYDTEYEYGVLLSIRSRDTSYAPAIIFNGINNEITEINILECMFGVYSPESCIINEMYNGMIISM